MMGPMRIVSIGDSFTEGLDDRRPDGTPLGWADRVAMGLAAAHPDEEVWYANLAIRGSLMGAIANEQLEAALALEPPPTHLTFAGGGNDMLRSSYSDARMAELITRVLDACEAAGVHVIVMNGPDPSERLPAGRRMRERGNRLTEVVDLLIDGRAGVVFVDNFRDPESREAPYWAPDRLHLNSLGHQRVASRVLTALGVPTPAPVVNADGASADAVNADGVNVAGASRGGSPQRALGRAPGEVRYWVVYVLPWLGRRILGKSSGDRRHAMFPTWVRVPANGEPPVV